MLDSLENSKVLIGRNPEEVVRLIGKPDGI